MNNANESFMLTCAQRTLTYWALALLLAFSPGGLGRFSQADEPPPFDLDDFPLPLDEDAPLDAVPEVDELPDEPGADLIDFTEGEVDPRAQMETAVVNGTEQITISLDDVSLEDTVRMFAQTTHANIIASGALLEDKRVTVSLRDVDWRPALRSILEIHDLTLTERTPGSGIYSIQARLPDAPEPTEVRTYFLNYTTVTEVKSTIRSMLSANAILTPFASRNALVVRSNESNLTEVEALLAELDRPGRQVLIEARILELNDAAAKQLGIRWDSLEAFSIQAGAGPFTWTDATERRTIRDSQDRYWDRNIEERLFDQRGREYPRTSPPSYIANPASTRHERLHSQESPRFVEDPRSTQFERFQPDGEPPQFIADPRTTQFERLQNPSTPSFVEIPGSTSYERYQTVLDPTRTIQTGRDSEWGRAYQSLREQTRARSAIIEMDSLNIILSALERTEGVSMVSNPKMIVTSGSTNAFFSVGDREPIIEIERERARIEGQPDLVTARLATGINTEFITDGYLETGVDLRVIATVKTDDFIEADIRPSLRRLISLKRVGDNSWPIISVKEIGTSFTLRSGQTVAIGGLTETTDDKQVSRVPFLGNIPLLGRLFRHEKDVKRQTETIIFVTLTIADPDMLESEAGIPVDSRLVHSRLLRERASRHEWEQNFNAQRDAFEAGLDLQEIEVEAPEEVPAWLPESDDSPRAAPAPRRNLNDALPR